MKYTVTVRKVMVLSTVVEVDAPSENAARRKARARVREFNHAPGFWTDADDSDPRVVKVAEVK